MSEFAMPREVIELGTIVWIQGTVGDASYDCPGRITKMETTCGYGFFLVTLLEYPQAPRLNFSLDVHNESLLIRKKLRPSDHKEVQAFFKARADTLEGFMRKARADHQTALKRRQRREIGVDVVVSAREARQEAESTFKLFNEKRRGLIRY